LLLILALGLGLRLYRLADQSVWYDEYISVSHIHDPDLVTALESQRAANWNLVPVYYTLQYLVGHYVTSSIVAIRLLSVAFGMATIALIFFLGRDLFGPTAGLAAALLLALSPTYIYQAQELRNYAVSLFFGLLSMYTFLHLVRTNARRWWLFHLAANVLFVWSHLFGVFLFLPQGLFLLLFRRRALGRTIVWIALNLAFLAPVALWISHLDVHPPKCPPPAATQILSNLFLDSLITTWHPGLISEVPWKNAPPHWVRAIEPAYPYMDYALLATLVAAIAALALRALRGRPAASQTGTRCVREAVGLLLLWQFVPVLFLFTLSRLWRPDVFSPKYSNWAYLATLLLAGGAVALCPKALWRRIAMAGLIALYGYRVCFALTYPQRTDWNSLTRYIKTHGITDDVLITSWTHDFVLEYNLAPYEGSIEAVPEISRVFDEAEQRLEAGAGVWTVFAGSPYTLEGFLALRRYWQLRGVPFEEAGFLGMQPLLAIHAGPLVPYQPPPHDQFIEALARDIERQDDAFLRRCLGRLLETAGRLEEAAQQYGRSLDMIPQDKDARDSLVRVLARMGRNEEAIALLTRMIDWADTDDLLALVNLHMDAQDPAKAAEVCLSGIEHNPTEARLYMRLGQAYAAAGRYPDAEKALSRVIEIIPDLPWGYISLGEVLEAAQRPDEALEYFRKAAALPGPESRKARLALAQALERLGQKEEAIAQYRALITEDPTPGMAQTCEGVIFEVQGNTAQAMQAYLNAIEEAPDFFLPYRKLYTLAAATDTPEAQTARWRAVVETHPDSPHAHLYLAMALEAAQDLLGAEDAYRAVCRLNPDDPAGHANLGQVLTRRERFDEAVHEFRAALTRNPGIDHVRSDLVWSLYSLGRVDEARAEALECERRGVVLPAELVARLVDQGS